MEKSVPLYAATHLRPGPVVPPPGSEKRALSGGLGGPFMFSCIEGPKGSSYTTGKILFLEYITGHRGPAPLNGIYTYCFATKLRYFLYGKGYLEGNFLSLIMTVSNHLKVAYNPHSNYYGCSVSRDVLPRK